MRHYSTQEMAKRLVGLLDTDDINEFEQGFIETMQRHLDGNSLTSLSDRQIEVLESIHKKHFA